MQHERVENHENKVIEVEGLTKRFGNFTAVDHISFQVHRGEIFGFLGANGAGKTTAMRMLTGLSRPTGGKACVAGFDDTGKVPLIVDPDGASITALKPDVVVFINVDKRRRHIHSLFH